MRGAGAPCLGFPARTLRASRVRGASGAPASHACPPPGLHKQRLLIPAPCLAALGRAARADRVGALPCRAWPAGSALTRALATQAPPRSEPSKVSLPTPAARAAPGLAPGREPLKHA